MPIWRLPVLLADGSRVRVALDSESRIQVVDSDGSTLIAVANDPHELPPDEIPFVVDSDGTTRIPLAYERVYYSMNLTTIDRVKALLTGNMGTSNDALLTRIVEDVSSRFERYMRRQVLKQTNVEDYPIRRGATTLSLKATPVESITSIKYVGHPNDFATTQAMDDGLYVLETPDAGLIRFQAQMTLLTSRLPGYARVTYVGGMATDTTDLIDLFPDLAQAADVQCAEEFRRRNTPGGNVQQDGGGTQYQGQLDLLDSVKRTLDSYRRYA